ncbi:fasciclin domain-containing protein [Spongiivirga citrea]|uniref:FAS1 domain-containing protein n=1 Tax=Spongiivirga citrea TaxID=1481457 RepID=A0A6M0CDT6_9FLAO|nr:fasciclin domain-containing protein [Spongiivirga citrea]NER15988.1 hypothetical protein [Spongiivirga citrea]
MHKLIKSTAYLLAFSFLFFGCEVQTLDPELEQLLEDIQNNADDDTEGDQQSEGDNDDSNDGSGQGDGSDGNSDGSDGGNDGSGDGNNDGGNDNATQNIIQYIIADANYSTFKDALDRVGLTNALNNDTGSFTIFIPDNDAFDRYFATLGIDITLDNIQANLLTAIINYHLKSGATASGDFMNGYVSTLAKEPSNNQDIDLYIQTGSSITINGTVMIEQADIAATNGTIHKVTEVLKLPAVSDFINADPQMSSLKSIVTDDINAALSDLDTDFTIFAPTNQAINGTDLSGFTSEQVVSILNYHTIVATGGQKILISARLMDGMSITTQETGVLTVSKVGNDISITDEKMNTNTLSTLDIQAWNGVVHMVDGVLLPDSI